MIIIGSRQSNEASKSKGTIYSRSPLPTLTRMVTQKRPRQRQITSPLLPPGVEIIVPPTEACTAVDHLLVYISSLIVVGSPIWFYGGIIYLYRRWKIYHKLATTKNDEEEITTSSGECSKERPLEDEVDSLLSREQCRKFALRYRTALALILITSIIGLHRSVRIGQWLNVRRWRLWDAWLNYVGFTVLRDTGCEASPKAARGTSFDPRSSPVIYAFVPHGIFPFGLAFSCLPERGYGQTWGLFRPVVATATRLFPLVRTFIDWMGGVDASRQAVSFALESGRDRRLGISPGGIAEIFETYPKPGYHPNDEAALLKDRDGMFKLALKHDIPIVPVYCFGATKMFRRVQLPHFIESLSRFLRISLCVLYGKCGLPIPFRQRLMYVVGKTIWPDLASEMKTGERRIDDELVRKMHDAFCDEVQRIFDRNKSHYGWSNKTLRLV